LPAPSSQLSAQRASSSSCGPLEGHPDDFAGLAAVQERLLAFQRRYKQAARPFEWKFSRAHLARLIKRLAATAELPPAA
jgi:hypothetical protein